MIEKLLPMNIGPADRIVRALLGAVLLALVFVGPHTPWGWLGLIPLITALAGSCPIYTALGISTAHRRQLR